MHSPICLGLLLYPTGYHAAAWRAPGVPPDAGMSIQYYADAARLAEGGLLDFVFLADSLTMQGDDADALSHLAIRYVAQLEPVTLLSAVSASTSRIGIACSITTTYQHPYHVARQLASLDHISGGRAGWNVVTSKNRWEGSQFGQEMHPPHAERYARAHEFVTVVKGLWDTWEDDAFSRDKETGIFFQPNKLHLLQHHGKFFHVRGPLNVERPPQGHPVIFQAGSSSYGRDLGAAVGEVIYTAHSEFDSAKEYYSDVHQRAESRGRTPGDIRILPGVVPIVGRSRSEAEEKVSRLKSLIDSSIAMALLQQELEDIDLENLDIDGPLPMPSQPTSELSRQATLLDTARRRGFSIRDLAHHVASSRGHLELVGTPNEIVGSLLDWVDRGAADGFMIMPAIMPDGLRDVVELLVPEFQRRGRFRTAYAGSTLRENLGLRRPTPCYH